MLGPPYTFRTKLLEKGRERKGRKREEAGSEEERRREKRRENGKRSGKGRILFLNFVKPKPCVKHSRVIPKRTET